MASATETAAVNVAAMPARSAKGNGHLRRVEFLAAAERIFVRDGYRGATIRKIAKEVGVSSTALYAHFRDKHEILEEICGRVLDTLLATDTEPSATRIDPVARVRLLLEAYMRSGFANPNAYWLAFCATRTDAAPGEEARVSDLGDRWYASLKDAVSRVAAEGRLRGAIDAATQVLWAACHGVVSMRIARANVAWMPDETLIKGVLDSLFYGELAD